MSQAVWTGSISFGLVDIPVRWSRRARPHGENIEGAVPAATVDDLMATLKASVETAKRKGEGTAKARQRAERHSTG
jgi:non-homologous end joining protein Ku